MAKLKKSSMSKKEKAQFNQSCENFHQKVKDEQKHNTEIIECASRVIEIEMSDGTREEKYERELGAYGEPSFWVWEWFRPFYLKDSDLDVVKSEHQLRDAVCKEGQGKLPKYIEVNLYDVMEQILHRFSEDDKRITVKVIGYSTVKLFNLPKDWVFKTETDAMTVGEFNKMHKAKFDNE